MMKSHNHSHGFTLIELLNVVAIIAILATLAVFAYQHYTERARGADIIEKYDALRTSMSAQALTATPDDCAALIQPLGNSNLSSPYATLAYGFETVSGGYRPVLTVCAEAGKNGPLGARVAHEVHDTMAKIGVVEKGAVLTDSLVSFAMRLTDSDQALCKIHTARITAACGQPQAQQNVTPNVIPTPTVTSTIATPTATQSPVQTPPVQTPPVQTPPVQTPPVQTPPAQTPSQGGFSPNPVASLILPTGSVDLGLLITQIESLPALNSLDATDKTAVVSVATQMAVNPRYALMVREAQQKAPAGRPALVPTATNGLTTIRFYDDMNQALNAAYLDAQRRICRARNGPNAACG